MNIDFELPKPTGHDPDGTPWWRLSSGERVYALPGYVYLPTGDDDLGRIEWDAWVHLAAVAWARTVRTPGGETA